MRSSAQSYKCGRAKERYVVIKKKSATSSDIQPDLYTKKFRTILVLVGNDSDKFSLTDRLRN